ncbi:MAG TPA: addiction module protein [Polyangium sp.]|nr:addiction module protein [Polyangium sp.]
MPPELQRIKDELLSLPMSSRALLARLLLDSLETPERDDELERRWAGEADERVRQIEANEVVLLDGDDVLREIRTICR